MTEEVKPDAKEDLPIRQNLVDTAVGFLLNPNVKQKPDEAKVAFLKQKGLTDSEVAEAFSRVKYETGAAIVSSGDSHLANAYPLPPYQAPYPFWFHLRNYSSTFVSFAVAVYVLHRFYKSYLEPWLFGSKTEQSEISALKQQLTELNNSVSRLTSTVALLEEAVSNQIHHIDRTSLYCVESVPKSVRDILDEVSNVKSLLLNRYSFPAPPSLVGTVSTENKTLNGESKSAVKVVTIPKWQLRDSEHGKSKADSNERLSENVGEEKSSELSPIENGLSSDEDHTQDQENDLEMTKEKIQDEVSKNDSEDKNKNSKMCVENNLSVNGKFQDDGSETAVENHVRIKDEKTLDEDSGVQSHNYLSDPESTDQANESSGSARSSE